MEKTKQKPLYKVCLSLTIILLIVGIITLVGHHNDIATLVFLSALIASFVPNLLNKEKIGYIFVIVGIIVILLSLLI